MCVASRAQSNQNSKTEISFQYLKVNYLNKVDFLSAYKHQRFLLIDTMCVWSDITITKKKLKQVCYFFGISSQDLLHADKHDSFLQII